MKINKQYTVTDRRKHGGKRKSPVKVLIPHHNAGVATGENLAKYMRDTTRQLSATYVIGQEGEIFETLDESLEPYTTSNRAIDTQAITFEMVNSTGAPQWKVADATMDALVELSIDICKRHGIKSVSYTGDKTGNIHLHEWYAQTNCPGPYVKGMMPEYARRINEGLGKKVEPKPAPKPVVAPKPKPVVKSVTDVAKEVIAGKYGVGAARKKALGSRYAAVQTEVNRLLGIKTAIPKPTVDIDNLARRTYNGEFGNGAERKRRLGKNYAAVQARVNELYYKK